MSPLDTGEPSVEKVNTTSQAGSTSHCVFKPDFSTPNTRFMGMTFLFGSHRQPFFGFTPPPNLHTMQTPQLTTHLPSYTTSVWATTLFEEVKALTVSSGKVEKTVDSMNLKVTSSKKRLENLETK